ncbi:MAG TPA: hypothetical protein VK530_14915 [Candidatus Acidoferrum sp.]|nr:hypothetical protein [Candidatus Acidoferrum sp.]
MNNPIHDELIRLSLKRELNNEDRARIDAALAAHPELREQWETDAALGRMLRQLPDAPISSNFNSRVMEAIELEERETQRATNRPRWRAWLRRVQPRMSWALALALVSALSAYQYRVQQGTKARAQVEQAQFVHEIRNLSQDMVSLPGPEVFKDFEVINQFRQVSSVSDDDLLRVLR